MPTRTASQCVLTRLKCHTSQSRAPHRHRILSQNEQRTSRNRPSVPAPLLLRSRRRHQPRLLYLRQRRRLPVNDLTARPKAKGRWDKSRRLFPTRPRAKDRWFIRRLLLVAIRRGRQPRALLQSQRRLRHGWKLRSLLQRRTSPPQPQRPPLLLVGRASPSVCLPYSNSDDVDTQAPIW
jgi:hypothetical protein